MRLVGFQGPDTTVQLDAVHLLEMPVGIGHPVQISDIQGCNSPVPAICTVDAGLRIHQEAVHLAAGLDDRNDIVHDIVQAEIVISADVGAMRRIQVHPELLLADRRPDKVQFRMEGEAGARAEVELLLRRCLRLRFELHVIGPEFVGALERLLEHGIVEIQIEPRHRIRHRHLLGGLVDGRGATFVGVRHLHGGIEVLSKGQGGHRRREGRREDMLSHLASSKVSGVSVLPGRGSRPPGRTACNRT